VVVWRRESTELCSALWGTRVNIQ